MKTGAPQGCVLGPLLYSPYTTTARPLATPISLFQVLWTTRQWWVLSPKVMRQLTRCEENHLILNVTKTKEMIVDFWRCREANFPITINGAAVSEQLSFPRCTSGGGSHIVSSQEQNSEVDTAAPILSQETEQIRHGPPHPQDLPPRCHWDHPHWMHHYLVWQQHCLQPQSSSESGAVFRKDNWRGASHPPGHLQQAVPEESGKGYQRLRSPQSKSPFNYFRQVGGTGLSGPEPADWGTAFSIRASDCWTLTTSLSLYWNYDILCTP